LYAVIDGGYDQFKFDLPDKLATIDTTSAVTTVVGSIGFAFVQALAFGANGVLYGWDLYAGLITIDPATAQATQVNPGLSLNAQPNIQTLAFAPDAVLYGACDALYRIHKGTSQPTLIGSGGYSDVRGIEPLDDWSGPRLPPFVRYAWAWMFLVGYILITPIGPLCIVCGGPLTEPWVRVLGAGSLVMGALGLRHYRRQRARSSNARPLA
jgi:hypothetical protein